MDLELSFPELCDESGTFKQIPNFDVAGVFSVVTGIDTLVSGTRDKSIPPLYTFSYS